MSVCVRVCWVSEWVWVCMVYARASFSYLGWEGAPVIISAKVGVRGTLFYSLCKYLHLFVCRRDRAAGWKSEQATLRFLVRLAGKVGTGGLRSNLGRNAAEGRVARHSIVARRARRAGRGVSLGVRQVHLGSCWRYQVVVWDIRERDLKGNSESASTRALPVWGFDPNAKYWEASRTSWLLCSRQKSQVGEKGEGSMRYCENALQTNI